MALARRIEPELLDALPAHDPRAVRARRGLRRVNILMLQAGIMAGAIAANFPGTPRRIVDLGCGDGTFMLAVARRLVRRWPRLEIVLADKQDIVSATTREKYSSLGYAACPVAADIFEFLRTAEKADVIVANLFLHHFTPAQLMPMLAEIAKRTTLFVACEPRRARFPLFMSRLLGLVGCNDVARLDAVTSVHAGFDGQELSVLWPDKQQWQLEERPARLFTHLFVARRSGDAP